MACTIARLMVLGPDQEHPRLGGDRLTWEIADDFYLVARVHDWGILLVHGDQIPMYGTFPWYGVARKMREYGDLEEPWDYFFTGHFHTYAGPVAIGTKILCANGTPVSNDPYSRRHYGGGASPCQRLSFFNAKHGLIADAQVYVERVRVPEVRRYGSVARGGWVKA